jgi:hypothetical protein
MGCFQVGNNVSHIFIRYVTNMLTTSYRYVNRDSNKGVRARRNVLVAGMEFRVAWRFAERGWQGLVQADF